MSVRNYLSTPSTCLQHQDEQQNEHQGPEGIEKEEEEEEKGLSASPVTHDIYSLLLHAHVQTDKIINIALGCE